MNVIVADDSMMIRNIVTKTLESMGYRSVHAKNGREVLDILEKGEETVELILLDWNMPVIDGFDTLKAVKQDNRFNSIPVMMITTESEDKNIQMAFDNGAVGYLTKPFTSDELEKKSWKCFRIKGDDMRKILLIDCVPEAVVQFKQFFNEDVQITDEAFDNKLSVAEYHLIIICMLENDTQLADKVKRLRFGTKFRNIPIILFKPANDFIADQPFLLAGANEVLSLNESAAALKQILQGYLTPGRKPMDKEMQYLTPFIDNTINVLTTMASVKPELKDVYFRKDLRLFGDVSGVIGLSGEAEGTVVITFYWDLAQNILSKLMGVDKANIDAEIIHDGVGELINMICGSAKKLLADTPYYFHLSLPTVVLGWGHEIGHLDNAKVAVLVFDIDDKSFVVQVAISPKMT